MGTDTCFVISHNFQLSGGSHDELRGGALVGLISRGLATGINIEEIDHPHWRARVSAPLEPIVLARSIGQTLRSQRARAGESDAYTVLLLGGRKDLPAQPKSPLQLGMWGVDLIETNTPQAFLIDLSWEALKVTRPEDSVFEIWEPDNK